MAKSEQEKLEKFRYMAATRLPKAVKAIELLGNLSRQTDYAWTDADLQNMIDALDTAVDGVLEAFGVSGESSPPREETEPDIEIDATPPVAREMTALGDLGTQQLVDRMIACGAELANRRK